jgi:hypothetical protein
MYENRIKHLKESHRVLDNRIAEHEKLHPGTESQTVQEWKKQQLAFENEIRRLERLQWEHDHDTVDFDDDR